jgi:UPF0755 protein
MPFPGRGNDGSRSADDRARAAAERAARRAARRGRPVAPPPPEAFQDAVPPPDVADLPRSDHPPAYDPPQDAAQPEPDHDAEPQPAAIEGEDAGRQPTALDADAGRDGDGDGALEYDEDRRSLTAVQDRPPSPRRVPATRRRPVRRPPPPRTPRPRRPRQPARPPRSRAGSWGRRLGALLALAVIGFALYVINETFQPFHGDATGSVRITIPPGADAGQIGEILAERGVVASGTFFQLNATVTGRRGGLRPGDYTLRENMSYGAAIDALTKGPKAKVVPTVNVTVPEGPSIRETAPIVDKGPLKGSYSKAAMHRRVLRRVRRLGAPRGTRTPEGFLFPATYTLVDASPARDLVSKQLQAFEENFGKIDLAYAKRRNLSRYDVLIIASLVERETQLPRERRLVASVIYNRLRDGIPLGIDATIRYETRNWRRPIRLSELETDTPYNTRVRRGLPPTPIGNPGQGSIEAAARPARTDHLFFVVKPCGNGAHAFTSDYNEFLRLESRYREAQEARGGSPADCP